MGLPLSIKDLSDWLKVITLIICGAVAYAHITDSVQANTRAIMRIGNQTNRIEKYLSSRDPNYWPTVKGMDDPQDQDQR